MNVFTHNWTYVREIHIDCHVITKAHASALLAAGFHEDDFTAAGGGLDRPAHHFTWETEGSKHETLKARSTVFQQAVDALTKIRGFSGYIESEVIRNDFQVAFPERRMRQNRQLPLPKLALIRTLRNKIADLHIKVPLRLIDGHLESEFARVGCYYVETPKNNRIYTMQFLSHRDGLHAFNLLKNFFSESGGSVEITYEVCDAFIRVPVELQAPTIVEKGSLFHH